jgi:hypothetical protein
VRAEVCRVLAEIRVSGLEALKEIRHKKTDQGQELQRSYVLFNTLVGIKRLFPANNRKYALLRVLNELPFQAYCSGISFPDKAE